MPDILEQSGQSPSFIFLSGQEGAFSWRGWNFHWRKEQTDRFFLGETQALLPSEEGIFLCPLAEMRGREEPGAVVADPIFRLSGAEKFSGALERHEMS
ncbi:hypothetical protein MASR2M79_12850 [Aminivibrio sp.]